jgi:hypothetical protein
VPWLKVFGVTVTDFEAQAEKLAEAVKPRKIAIKDE